MVALVPPSRAALRLAGTGDPRCAPARDPSQPGIEWHVAPLAIDRLALGLAGSGRLRAPVVSRSSLVLALITAPFDRGRYSVGLLFRKIGPAMATLNPLWRFRYLRQDARQIREGRTWSSPITSRSPTSS